MKKLRILLTLACFTVIAVAMIGCGGGSSGGGGGAKPAVLQSIAVTPGALSITLGQGLQFTATGKYSDNTSKDLTSQASWSSSSTGVATISSSGMATSKAVGSTTITASFSGVNGSTTLTITAPTLTSLAVTPVNPSIAANTTLQFAAMGTFSDGSQQNVTGSVQWASASPSVASINVNGASGLAMGLSAGTSLITASSGSISSSTTLTVTGATVTSIAVTPVDPSVPLGTLQQFTATGTFSDGTIQDITGTVTWSTSKQSVMSITTSGLGTARNLGTSVITATFGSVSGSVTATVNAADLASLVIQPGDSTIAATTSLQFSAVGTFNDGSTHDLTTQASWASSDTGVAKVGSGSGVAKGLAQGTTTITATVGSSSASITLTVTNATLVSISVTPVGRTIAPGTKLSFAATGTFSDSSTQNITRDATWASDNPAVATLGSVSLVTGVAPGTANISATLDGVTGSTLLTVSSATLVSIAVNPASAVLAPASTLGLNATGTYSDGTQQTITNAVTWSSSSAQVASVSAAGQVTGQSAGTATITAQSGSVTGSMDLLVESSALTSLAITPATASVAVQTSIQLRAIGGFADGTSQDLTQSASWTSSPSSVATVGDSGGTKGIANGISAGTATVTALFAGEVGTATLTVTNATLTSITILPANPSIALGNTQRFTATGNFSDGSTENLTSQVTWNSSNVGVATITSGGLATSVATGTTTITASMNGVNGQTVLTVF
ncbi:MAG TPA: Ig-like domain-containing protein [Terriglobales bacterium]|nr:Ig-like domain-containing protein [Terriglobales bacterium]